MSGYCCEERNSHINNNRENGKRSILNLVRCAVATLHLHHDDMTLSLELGVKDFKVSKNRWFLRQQWYL